MPIQARPNADQHDGANNSDNKPRPSATKDPKPKLTHRITFALQATPSRAVSSGRNVIGPIITVVGATEASADRDYRLDRPMKVKFFASVGAGLVGSSRACWSAGLVGAGPVVRGRRAASAV
jgi:hypothetical protein